MRRGRDDVANRQRTGSWPFPAAEVPQVPLAIPQSAGAPPQVPSGMGPGLSRRGYVRWNVVA